MAKIIPFFTGKYEDQEAFINIKARHTAIILLLICFDLFMEIILVFVIGDQKQDILLKDTIALGIFIVMLLLLKSGHIITTGNMMIAASVYELVDYFSIEYTFQFYLQCLLSITVCVAIYIKKYQLYSLLFSTVLLSSLKLSYLPVQLAKAKIDIIMITGELLQLTIAVVVYIMAAMFFDRIIRREINSGRRMKELAETDVLTSLYNRQRFDETMENLTGSNQEFGLAFFDIDHFKKINDTHGHMTGDHVLQSFSKIMQQTLGKDCCFRWGGEEFAFIFTDGDRKSCEKQLEVFIEAVRKEKMADNISITISIGWVYNDKSFSSEQLLINVDQALYLAKSNGRDQIAEFMAGGD